MAVDLSNLRRTVGALDEALAIYQRELANHTAPDVQVMLRDAQEWLLYLQRRNLTSHVYSEPTAMQVFEIVPQFPDDARFLLAHLEERLR
ncbi:MAG: nucleotidyltransferase substrate binding protein [Candidatus Brachytrichaceae bacterium NZ_4S206]|jgi:hypothetical protein